MDLGAFASDTSTTVLEAERTYEADGYTGQFRVEANGDVECLSCRKSKPGDSFDFVRACRVEGTSDPDDEAIVLALVCPLCDAKGTLALPYGPEATAEEASVLRGVYDARTDGA